MSFFEKDTCSSRVDSMISYSAGVIFVKINPTYRVFSKSLFRDHIKDAKMIAIFKNSSIRLDNKDGEVTQICHRDTCLTCFFLTRLNQM